MSFGRDRGWEGRGETREKLTLFMSPMTSEREGRVRGRAGERGERGVS
jgi:hypothetical protein